VGKLVFAVGYTGSADGRMADGMISGIVGNVLEALVLIAGLRATGMLTA
jgi:hypothetical protein